MKNLALLTDLYQITMMQGYFNNNIHQNKVVFDLFYRKNPSNGGYAIVAGLEQAAQYLKELNFSQEDIEYLKSLDLFTNDFLKYLSGLKFTGEVYAMPEGTVVFPYEPILRIKANLVEAQLIETALLNIINHQSLIATKSSRVKWAAGSDNVMEFGLRRAQGPDAGVYGARAAVIGGCSGTSNVLTGKKFGVPVKGTQAHSWIMTFKDELTAFRAYAEVFPNGCLLLVDTYDTLKSGVPNAITVFKELKEQGKLGKGFGIRLDSGDMAYLSKQARIMLDEAGFKEAVICASSDLDEHLIASLKSQGAKITLWGVGTSLITSKDCPAFGGVYKLAAEENANGEIITKIKLSENPEKVTNPGIKKVIRFYEKSSHKIKADLIALDYENFNENEDLTIFDQLATWKKMLLIGGEYEMRELLVPVFIDGECVYEFPTVLEISEYCNKELETLWDEYKRIVNPHILPVDLSENLYNLKQNMIKSVRN